MRTLDRLAIAGLAGAAVLVACGLLAPLSPPSGAARVERTMPHATLLTFEDGAFTVVPHGALDRYGLQLATAEAGASRSGGTW